MFPHGVISQIKNPFSRTNLSLEIIYDYLCAFRTVAIFRQRNYNLELSVLLGIIRDIPLSALDNGP